MAGIRKNWRTLRDDQDLAFELGRFTFLGWTNYASRIYGKCGKNNLTPQEISGYYEARVNILKWYLNHERRTISEKSKKRLTRKIESAQKTYLESIPQRER